MPETATLHPADERATVAWFDGILVGAVGDLVALRTAVAELNEAGPVRATIDLDGGRFSLLLDDAPIAAARLTDAARAALVERLQQVVEAAAARVAVESTLRCTQVRSEDVVETLFVVQGRRVKGLSRQRPRTTEDDVRAGPRPSPLGTGTISRGAILKSGALFLVVFLLLAWQSGYVDRLFAPRFDKLALRLGPFSDVVAVEVTPAWGDYVVTLRRGPGWPATNEQVQRLVDSASDPAARAAMQAVSAGDAVYVRLEDPQGKVLEVARVELRPLVARVDGSVEVRLHGHLTAATVGVELDAGAAGR